VVATGSGVRPRRLEIEARWGGMKMAATAGSRGAVATAGSGGAAATGFWSWRRQGLKVGGGGNKV
jgi:hypothetical protein